MIESITALDLSILDFIRNTLSSPVADIIMKCLTYSIEYGAMAILVFIVMMFVKKMRKTGFAVMGATLSVLLFGELILKHIVCRPRPFAVNSAIDIIIKAPSGFSFPSSHTATCFAMATAIYLFHKRLGIIAYIYAEYYSAENVPLCTLSVGHFRRSNTRYMLWHRCDSACKADMQKDRKSKRIRSRTKGAINMTENKNVFGILGHPLGHTLSPQIHTRLFEISGEQAEYKILDTPPEKLTDSFEYFKSLTGFNITIPYKIDIIKMCDTLDDTAKRYNSVNCIANVNGVSTGYNTDCTGFTKAVGAMGMTLTNKVLLLGCGGVGRMMAIEAVREGGELTIAVRDADIPVAKALCKEIKQNYNSAKVGFCLLSEVKGDFDLMVNATPVGMYPNTDASPLTEEALGRITLNGFFDAIYNPRETKLMKMVSDKGVKKVSGGMQMLVWQAAVAHTIWSGAEYTAEQVQAISDEMMRLV